MEMRVLRHFKAPCHPHESSFTLSGNSSPVQSRQADTLVGKASACLPHAEESVFKHVSLRFKKIDWRRNYSTGATAVICPTRYYLSGSTNVSSIKAAFFVFCFLRAPGIRVAIYTDRPVFT